MKPEQEVEQHLVRRVKALGGLCVKLAPIQAGVPDRLVILPPGTIDLVELKAPKGRTRPIQIWWHSQARRVGYEVPILASVAAVDRWLDKKSK